MMKKFFSKFRFLFRNNDKENIKNVIEDLIEENKNGSEKIDDGTKKIFKNVINLSDKCLEDVMIPRADIDAVSIDTKVDDLVSFINKTKHSRIPVFQDNLDKIIGMIHIRDLFEKVNNDLRFSTKLLEPFLIGTGKALYPLATGLKMALSRTILNFSVPLLNFSKHSFAVYFSSAKE